MKRYVVLDSFRGIFALCVVLFHSTVIMSSLGALSFFRHSNLFVDFFFVLSGFVIAHGYSNKNKDLMAYALSRTFRIVPLHVVMLVVFVALELVKLIALKHSAVLSAEPFSGATDLRQIIPNLLLIQAWYKGFDPVSFNYPAWSISVEFWIYFLFYLSLYLKPRSRLIVWIFMSITAVAGRTLLDVGYYDYVLRGIGGFCLGTLVYLVHVTLRKKGPEKPKIMTAAEGIALFGVIYLIAQQQPLIHRMAPVIFGPVILIFSFEAGAFSSLLKKGPFLFVGKLSYSIYMVHAMVLTLVHGAALLTQKYFGIALTGHDGNRAIDIGLLWNNLILVFVLGLVVAIAYLSYNKIEVPWRNLGKSLSRNVRGPLRNPSAAGRSN